ncbi:PHP domain-containing protein [Clostridium sp. 'White wine YQ']|uniref:PHP domain-containing protein n=1 Tax=Clostridium sp. 'White wine YQ' TaxID=3027474 RepID=UPI0023664D09|nr:PHP domain-containing protein [Clostridium sp. 'White wine YQ']MDD7793037.1 PHP domain-containing protein [Clostridium sp. 'White wine YQ']
MIKVDMHTHTIASDGRLTPRELITRAKENGSTMLAITDHDTVDSLEEASTIAKELSLEFIPGIELSTVHNGESIHMLGFFKDDSYKNKELLDFLLSLKDHRVNRGRKIVENLKKYFNIEISYDNVLKRGKGVIARPHIADEIIASGYPYTKDEIFDKFISNKSPAYVENKKITVPEGIALLKKYNALVFLAHPILIRKTPIKDFTEFDFDGFEAIYFQNKSEQTKKLIKLCAEKNLLVSAGGDFHGDLHGDTKHGDLGITEIPEDMLNAFKKAYYNL